MSVPVTSRLDESVVEALDRAVAAGLAATRGGAVAAAVSEWLRRHGEEAIIASYRQRYADAEEGHEDLLANIAAFSVAACLAET